jgi:hypothetical protein
MTKTVNAALSLTLLLALMASALSVTAQERTEATKSFDLGDPAPMTGPLARAAIREAVRLAETTNEPTPSATGNIEQGRQSALSDWSRVRQLAPQTGLVVTVRGAPPVRRYFVAADESELIVAPEAGPVEHVARAEIAEITTLSKSARQRLRENFSWQIGMYAGILAGLVVGRVVDNRATGCDSCLGGVLLGGFAGGLAGAGLWYRAFLHESGVIVYRAP